MSLVTLSWVDTTGELAFTKATGYQTELGVTGIDAPPRELFTSPRTVGAGDRLDRRRDAARTIGIPIHIAPRDGDALTAVGELADRLAESGSIRARRTVNNIEQVRDVTLVEYVDGLEGAWDAQSGGAGFTWAKRVLRFRALDPYWYGPTRVVQIPFGDPTPSNDPNTPSNDPNTGSNGGTGAFLNLDTRGIVAVYPRFDIVGPFTTLNIRHSDGTYLELAAPLAAGSTLTVETDPFSPYQGPRLNSGIVNASLLTRASTLFDLPRGRSAVSISRQGDTAQSSITMTYRERFRTP